MGSCMSACCPCCCQPAPKDPKAAKAARKARKKALKSKKGKGNDEWSNMMCGCLCKGWDDEGESQNYINTQDRVFDCRLIGYDKYGNLRYGLPEHDRNMEMNEVMAVDTSVTEQHDEWYIVDACWLQEWLLHVHADTNVQPNPGPMYNQRLVMKSEESGEWIAKPNLIMEGDDRVGDYRRVTKETWELFCNLYPGSGPCIIGKYPTIIIAEPDANSEEGKEEEMKADSKDGLLTNGKKGKGNSAVEEKEKEKDEETTTVDVDPYVKSGKYPTDTWVIHWSGSEPAVVLSEHKNGAAFVADSSMPVLPKKHRNKYTDITAGAGAAALGGDSIGSRGAASSTTTPPVNTTATATTPTTTTTNASISVGNTRNTTLTYTHNDTSASTSASASVVKKKKKTNQFYTDMYNKDDDDDGVDDDMKNIL